MRKVEIEVYSLNELRDNVRDRVVDEIRNKIIDDNFEFFKNDVKYLIGDNYGIDVKKYAILTFI